MRGCRNQDRKGSAPNSQFESQDVAKLQRRNGCWMQVQWGRLLWDDSWITKCYKVNVGVQFKITGFHPSVPLLCAALTKSAAFPSVTVICSCDCSGHWERNWLHIPLVVWVTRCLVTHSVSFSEYL